MSGINLWEAQNLVLEYAKANLAKGDIKVHEGTVPDALSLQLRDGKLVPYYVLRFSDMMPASGGGSFMGAKYHEYYSYVDGICVASTPEKAREMASMFNATMVGKSFTNTSELSPAYGGGTFTVPSGERTPAAYVAITSLRYNINLSDVGKTYLDIV